MKQGPRDYGESTIQYLLSFIASSPTMARAKVNPARVNQPTNHRVPMILPRRAFMPVRSRNDELFFLASFVFVFQCAVHAPRICTENGQNCEGSGHQAIRHETRGLASCAPRASLACHCLFLTQPPMLTPFPNPGIYFLDTVDSIAPLQFCIPCCTVTYSNLSYDGSWRPCLLVPVCCNLSRNLFGM